MAIRFNKEWMDKVEYKDWLLSEPSNNTKAKCRLCMRSFSLSNMGESSLKSHAQWKKHQNTVKTSGKNTSVWGFLKKDDQKASTSTQKEEPLACKESEELSVIYLKHMFVENTSVHRQEYSTKYYCWAAVRASSKEYMGPPSPEYYGI